MTWLRFVIIILLVKMDYQYTRDTALYMNYLKMFGYLTGKEISYQYFIQFLCFHGGIFSAKLRLSYYSHTYFCR